MYLYTLIVSTLAVILSSTFVQAGFEHSCSPGDYADIPARSLQVCGRSITRLLLSKCPGGIHVGRRATRQAQVQAPPFLISQNEANQMLSSEKRGFDPNVVQGIHCECCLNRCSPREMEQYCKTESRRKRNAHPNDLNNKRSNGLDLTQEDVDEFYESLAKMDEPVDERETPINATIQLMRFNSNPVVQAMLKNKAINSMREEKEQANSGEKRSRDEDIPYEVLKKYIKTRLAHLLSDKHIAQTPITTVSSNRETKENRSPEAQKLLYRLLSET